VSISPGQHEHGSLQAQELKKLAESLSGLDLDLEQMSEVLLDYNGSRMDPPLDQREVLEIAEQYSHPDDYIDDKSTTEDSAQT